MNVCPCGPHPILFALFREMDAFCAHTDATISFLFSRFSDALRSSLFFSIWMRPLLARSPRQRLFIPMSSHRTTPLDTNTADTVSDTHTSDQQEKKRRKKRLCINAMLALCNDHERNNAKKKAARAKRNFNISY